MIDHLSQDQFEACVLGRSGPAESEHINECRKCREELERFGRTLALFRSAVRDLADDRVALRAPEAATFMLVGRPIPWWRWALVATGFIAVIVMPFFITENKPDESVEPVSSEMSPEAVMERLNRHLLRTVPGPMEPMLSLIPSEEFASTTGGAITGIPARQNGEK
jgi:anti-sigma factor RsiW